MGMIDVLLNLVLDYYSLSKKKLTYFWTQQYSGE